MNRDRTHEVEEILEREHQDIPILLTVVWAFDEGEYLEPGHSCNGYGRGWWCRKMEAEDAMTGEVVWLTEREIDGFMDKYHPNNLPEVE